MGAERLIETIMDNGVKLKNKDKIHVYFIQLGEEATKLVLPLEMEARTRGFNSLISLGTPSLKVQMKKANRLSAQYVAIIGIMEARKGICQLKDMVNGTQEEIPLENLLDHLMTKIDVKSLDFYSPLKDFIIEEAKEIIPQEE